MESRIKGSVDLSLYLLDTVGVSLVEGRSFGAEGTLRISYATSDDKLIEKPWQRVAKGIARTQRLDGQPMDTFSTECGQSHRSGGR